MGRRPNPIIQLYFDRGAKLDDASNRYEHSCKKCHETFTKGRQETLINHITRKCQIINQEERAKLLADVSLQRYSFGGNRSPPRRTSNHQTGLTGLDALAEVSRQHGKIDYGGQHPSVPDDFLNSNHEYGSETSSPVAPIQAPDSHIWTPNFGPSTTVYAQLMHHGYNANPTPMNSNASLQMAEAALGALDPHLSHRQQRSAPQPAPSGQEALVAYSHGQPPNLDASHSRHSSSLVHYVTNQPLPHDEQHSQPPTPAVLTPPDMPQGNGQQRVFIDFTHGQQSSPSTTAPLEPSVPDDDYIIPDTEEIGTPLTENGDSTFAMWDFTNPPTSPLAIRKVRGKFAPDRRSAVKEVRKKGACLRCRMLKKSCDSGDPCKECAKLEGARLWKGQCIRTRLSKIFEVFSSGLFMVFAHHAVEAAKQSGPATAMPGRLEVTYFPTSHVYMTFSYVEILHSSKTNHITLLNLEEQDSTNKPTPGTRPILYATSLLEKHQVSEAGVFTTSTFMHKTLAGAMDMKDRLLVAKALELWVLTTMLALPPSDFKTVFNANLAPKDIATIDHGSSFRPMSSNLVYLQVRRAVEKCTDILFKVVMVELEKSLIQRKQSDNFETFIGTILLLRCVEQICHLYKSFDVSTNEGVAQSSHQPGMEKPYQSPYKPPPPSWPLDKPPHYFWQQGERFSDLMCSMLKLRKVTPKTEIRNGVFVAVGESDQVREWFEGIQLKKKDLMEARMRPADAEDDTAWEFRWMGKAFMAFETVI
ncbi:hypothetical protein EJ08DRAFT_649198 [Tothia fuscella]|uniref:Zn(2)-C6 fungal-type domain-containing protein n=1 Tax=Tothia fuscella TaxID=1048955 RepID=A0A9P4TZP5_9PEZI|nr:hypothetical protein EJ08DRAFT_649198 [Tothia fuscella]